MQVGRIEAYRAYTAVANEYRGCLELDMEVDSDVGDLDEVSKHIAVLCVPRCVGLVCVSCSSYHGMH